MKASTAALALLSVALLCYEVSSSPAAVNFSGLCCTQYHSKALPANRVVMYQYTDSHCPQSAVIFTTVKGRMVCGKLGDKWVQDIVNPPQQQPGSG